MVSLILDSDANLVFIAVILVVSSSNFLLKSIDFDEFSPFREHDLHVNLKKGDFNICMAYLDCDIFA